MPLFKVTRNLNHNLITYAPDSIHNFDDCEATQHLVNTGVLIPIDSTQKAKLAKTSLEVGNSKEKTPSEKVDVHPTDKIAKTLCPTCQKRVEVLKDKTEFYRASKGTTIMKKEVCSGCNRSLISKAKVEETEHIHKDNIKILS